MNWFLKFWRTIKWWYLKRNNLYKLILLLILVIAIEIISRLFISISFNTPFLTPQNIIYFYYPELKKLNTYSYDENKINLLVLGGSVVYDGKVDVILNGDSIHSTFCNIPQLLDNNQFNTLSLAMPAHNSLDSRYKYEFIKDRKFDYVFVYHGINDVRANNVNQSNFDELYRHIEFYDDIAIFFRHPEIKYFSAFFVIDWLAHQVLKNRKKYIPKEFYYALQNQKEPEFLKEGTEIKTKETFKSNFSSIIKLAQNKGEKVVMSTYAWYLDENYSLQMFRNKELDYDEQIWPTELYGLPSNVSKGLGFHNGIVKDLMESKLYNNLLFIDIEKAIPKNEYFFNDICHLNFKGCTLLSALLQQAILKDKSQ